MIEKKPSEKFLEAKNIAKVFCCSDTYEEAADKLKMDIDYLMSRVHYLTVVGVYLPKLK